MRRRSLAVAVIGLAAIAVLLIFVLSALQVIPLLPVRAESRTITVPDDYSSIQEAYDQANDGDTVFVKAGTYNVGGYVPIYIKKSISLIGENQQTTIINVSPYSYGGGSAIRVEAVNVVISGFTLVGSGTHNVGIFLWNTASNCQITDNAITHFPTGISVGSSNAHSISGNVITANGQGISISSENTVVSNNIIDGNGLGIALVTCRDVTIKGNSISTNGVNASEESAGGLSFWFENSNTRVYENTIVGNQFGIGFFRFGNNNSDIHNNEIANNTFGIQLSNETEGVGNRIYYNNLVNNTENAMVQTNVTNIVLWDNGLVGNYWSDYNGQGTYIIDENNIDYHPLTEQVDISTTAPGSSPEPETPLTTIAVIVAVITISAAVIVYLWRKKWRSSMERCRI